MNAILEAMVPWLINALNNDIAIDINDTTRRSKLLIIDLNDNKATSFIRSEEYQVNNVITLGNGDERKLLQVERILDCFLIFCCLASLSMPKVYQ